MKEEKIEHFLLLFAFAKTDHTTVGCFLTILKQKILGLTQLTPKWIQKYGII